MVKRVQHQTKGHLWRHGVRLYIAIGSLLASFEIWLWCRLAYGDNQQLVLIRSQQFYAWLAIACIGLALAIGPLYKLFPNLPLKAAMRDARRLIGVSGAWFAVLHTSIGYVTQFGGSGVGLKTAVINQPTLLGLAALAILLALAFTSFDKAMKGMGTWWFRLHRLLYVAGFLSLTHAFMIGTHASSLGPLMAVCGAVLLLIIFHACAALQRPQISGWQWLGISLAFLTLVFVGNYGVQRYTERLLVNTSHHQ